MPVFNQDPKINANANIITANSKEELPDPSTVKEGTVALIPSVAQSVYVYDSLDAAAAANLPEGSLVAVPSEGASGGGLPVVELSTAFEEFTTYTAEENAKLKEAWEKGTPVIIKCPLNIPNTVYSDTRFVWNRIFDVTTPDNFVFVLIYGTKLLIITSSDGGASWIGVSDSAG